MQLLIPTWIEIEGAKFKVRGLSGLEFLEMQESTPDPAGPLDGEDRKVKLTAAMVRQALVGVEDWQNVTDEAGNPLPFSPAARDKLPIKIMQEVVGHVLDKTFISEEREKNSSGQSTFP